jgi:hypothetical protein
MSARRAPSRTWWPWAIRLRLAATTVDDDPAKQILGELQADAAGALENLRDLARGIYPPLLADLGLAAALNAQASKSPLQVAVEADAIGRFPQDTEAAVYFCCLEALQNIAKYTPRQPRPALSSGAERGCPGPSGLRILIGSSSERTGSRGREIPEIHS